MPARMREDELAEPRRPSRLVSDVTRGVAQPVRAPEPDPTWSESARAMWDGYWSSGQAGFAQSSDAAMLWRLCHLMTRADGMTKPSAMLETAIINGLNGLLVTEGSRRAARIELDIPPDVETPSWALEDVSDDDE